MVIEIKPDIFKDKDFKSLNFLLQLISYRNRYSLFVDYTQVFNSEIYKRLDNEDKAIIIAEFNAYMTESKTSAYIVTTKSVRDNEFNIEEAIRFFIQPISVILENSLNDSYFIRTIIHNFGKGTIIKEHIDNNWLQFENAGGCTNVENFILGKLQSYNSLPKDNYSYLRCFVVLDSDKKYKDEPLKSEYKNLITFLNKNKISYHILEKRTMENYMPDDIFRDLATSLTQNWVDAYLNLDNEQKDYLNISKGFRKKDTIINRDDLDNKTRELYQNVSEVNYQKLKVGFQIQDFKEKFPKQYIENSKVNKQTLMKRIEHQTNPNEFHNIIEKISALI